MGTTTHATTTIRPETYVRVKHYREEGRADWRPSRDGSSAAAVQWPGGRGHLVSGTTAATPV
jgi:hypothetical protein